MTFADKVYDAVRRIPKGRVATYGQIADIIGCPGGARAVGGALHVNPYAPVDEFSSTCPARRSTAAPVVPCHRVVAADGRLAANFGCGGPAVQLARLQAEGVPFVQKRLSRLCTNYPCVDLSKCGIVIERHPLEPFLPSNGRILFLGSFPPPKARWSMEFFYPNWINDFWRIQGLIHFNNARNFEAAGNRFDRDRIMEFCRTKGLAFFDTASKVCRWKGNASDEFLEILEPANLKEMLRQMPDCEAIVTTGGKSSEELLNILKKENATPAKGSAEISVPPVGSYQDLHLNGRSLRWWRMPSTSRAYPMSLQDKAAQYSIIYDY